MASNSTISFTFKLDGDGKGFKILASDANGLKKALSSATVQAKQLSNINFYAITAGISQAQSAITQLMGTMKDLSAGYTQAAQAQTQLITVMRQRMGANDADIASVGKVIAAQSQLGIIGGTIQKRGAQQIATFLHQKESLDVLIPAMNNLIAQQKGVNATQEDAYTVANLMGKAMNGQITSLRRVGITFTESQGKVMKYGDESQRAAMLAEIITDNVGNMNAELGRTDIGKQKRLENTFAGIRNQIGGVVQSMLPYVTLAAQAAIAAGSLAKLVVWIKATTTSSKAATVATYALRNAQITLVAVTRVLKSAFTGAAIGATTLKVAIRGLMSATLVGAALVALGYAIDKLMSSFDSIADVTDKNTESEQEFIRASSEAKTGINNEIKTLSGLIASKKDASKEIAHLNAVYGSAFGTYSTAAQWYDVLTKKSQAYIKQIGYEAQAKVLASQIAEHEIKQEIALEKANQISKSGKAYKTDWVADGNVVKEVRVFTQEMKDAIAEATHEQLELNKLNNTFNVVRRRIASTNYSIGDTDTTKTPKTPKQTTPKKVTTKIESGNKEDNVYPSSFNSISDYEKAIRILQDRQKSADKETYSSLQKNIDALEIERDKFTGVYKEQEKEKEYLPESLDKLNTIKDINDALNYYEELQSKQSESEAAATEKTINAYKNKGKAIQRSIDLADKTGEVESINSLPKEERKIRIKAIGIDGLTDQIKELQSMLYDIDNPPTQGQEQNINKLIKSYKKMRIEAAKGFDTYVEGWNNVKGVAEGFDSFSTALDDNSNAWQRITSVIDGFIQLYQSISAIIGIIGLFTSASKESAAAKTAEGAATASCTAASMANAAAAGASVAQAIPEIAVNKTLTQSFMELATASYFAAHAAIPFAGFGIAAGFVASAVATTQAIAATPFANGGLISGPTLALMGEYPGASNNPEVVAPLDKLKGMIGGTGSVKVNGEFKLRGRDLVASIANETRITGKSGKRTNIKL